MISMSFDDGAPLRGPMAARNASDTGVPIVLSANSSNYVTIPTGFGKALFSATGGNDFWVQLDVKSLTVPSVTGTLTANNSPMMLNPLLVVIAGHTYICVGVGANACTVNIELFS